MDVNAGTPVVKVGADEIIGFDVKVTVLEEIVEDIVIVEESVVAIPTVALRTLARCASAD